MRADASGLMLFFAIAYAVEGLGQVRSGILGQPLTYFLKESLDWAPLQVSAGLALMDVPWIIKPLWGLISDFLPLFGYRRRTWLAAGALGASLSCGWVGLFAHGAPLIPVLVIASTTMAVVSTVCGALLVEQGQRLGASAAFVNQQWLWFSAAGIVAALGGGYLIEWFPASGALRAAAGLAALSPLTILISLHLIKEQPNRMDRAAFAAAARGLATALRSGPLWFVAVFLFCYYFSPGFNTPLYFHMTDRLKFAQGFIGALSAVNAGGWIFGGILYRYQSHRVSQRVLLPASLLIGATSTLLYLLVEGPVSAIIVWFISGAAGMVANVASISLAAAHCPKRAEGFTFAALMSVINLAAPASDTLGSWMYDKLFDGHLPPLILISAAVTLMVLPLVPFILRLKDSPD